MPTVLILGATSDMGYAIAKKFAAQGYDVQLAARKPESLSAYQSDIQIRYGRQCTVHAFDALDFNVHAAFYDTLSPKPDVSICVIGYMNENEKVITDWNESLKTLNTNYTGAVSILNIVAADYAHKGAGTIVGISSVAGNRGRQSNYIYGSAKAGFTAYLSGLRNALFKKGVHVMTVLPGFVNTKMTEHLKLPKPLTAQPAEVADAIYNGVLKKSNVVYVKWFWRYIMFTITSVPESIFKETEALMKSIAFFDFDGTITTKDTLLEFIKFTKGNAAFVTGFLLNSPYLVAYKVNIIPNQLAKEKVMRYFFKNTPLTEFQKQCDAFASEVVPKLIRPKAAIELQTLQQSGTTVVIVSASFGNWIQKWADANKFQLIATRPEIHNGKLTGRIEGKNCHGDEKVRRICETFTLQHYSQVHAYGDTSGDKPMLALATHAHYKPFRN